MKTSESIKAIAPALIKAQGEIKGSVVDAANPFFKSSYATLEAVWEAVKGPLNANGLFLSQGSAQSTNGDWALITRILHVSGEWIETSYPMVVTKEHDPQAMGSSCTYSRRYSLKAILSIPDIDDDAERATQRRVDPPKKNVSRETQEPPPHLDEFPNFDPPTPQAFQVTKTSNVCPTCSSKMSPGKEPNKFGPRKGLIDWFCVTCWKEKRKPCSFPM